MSPAPLKSNPFRMRNLVGGALALGLLAGIWLGDLFKGFGLGPGQGAGLGPGQGPGTGRVAQVSGAKRSRKSDPDPPDLVGQHAGEDDEPATAQPGDGLIKALIDDRRYSLRREGKRLPIELDELVRRIEQAEPNDDGLRAVIERTSASRVSAEDKLFDALRAAGVPMNSVYLAPQPVD
jgi:hypothetical protein